MEVPTTPAVNNERTDALLRRLVQEIIPGLYLGELRAFASDAVRTMLFSAPRNVKHVVRCIPPRHFKKDHDKAVGLCEHHGINLTLVDAEDDVESPISGHFAAAHAAIHAGLEKGEGVFVHCQAGVSRSATIIISYLMAYQQMTLDTAFSLVKRKRPVVCPNELFIQELATWGQTVAEKRQGSSGGVGEFDVDLHSTFQWMCRFLDNSDLRVAKAEFLEVRGVSPLLNLSSTPELQQDFSKLLREKDQKKKKLIEEEDLVALCA